MVHKSSPKEHNTMNSLFSLFLIAVGLSMDAFAVSICKGLAMKKITLKKACIVGLWFGLFQAIMPTIGYLLGSQFEKYITAIDHWIAFVLLVFIGASMLKEAFSKDEEKADDSLDFKTMFMLAVATSIDALAVGVTFAFLNVQIIPAVSFIGIITFTLSVAGVKIGNVFGTKYKSKAEAVGGIILIGMGIKILLEGIGIL
jgi:putative Mn2+ efflux pump MntP